MFTFTHAPDHIEVSLLPELMTLAEVAAEAVLVLNHVPGDAEADGRGSGWSDHPRLSVLTTRVVVA